MSGRMWVVAACTLVLASRMRGLSVVTAGSTTNGVVIRRRRT
jgi:hypothetical protein